RHLDVRTRSGLRKMKDRLWTLEPLVPDRQPRTIPVEDLHSVMPLAREDEEMPAQHVLIEKVAHQGEKAVKALPHIAWLPGEEHAYRRRKPDQVCASSTTSSFTSAPGSNPAGTRSRRPLRKTTS